MAVDMTAPAGRRILFTASTWSHLANFHRPYLRALADRGYLVDGACGGAPAELGISMSTLWRKIKKYHIGE